MNDLDQPGELPGATITVGGSKGQTSVPVHGSGSEPGRRKALRRVAGSAAALLKSNKYVSIGLAAIILVSLGTQYKHILSILSSSTDIPLYAKFEATYPASKSYSNPYDPAVVDVEAAFTAPNGSKLQVPGFYFQDYARSGSAAKETLSAAGNASWKVRFAPTMTGTYSYTVTLHDASGTTTLGSGSFNGVASSNPGYVKTAGLHLEFTNGKQFIPMGVNAPWFQYGAGAGGYNGGRWGDGTYGMDNLLAAYKTYGLNAVHLWTCSYPFAKPNINCGASGIPQMTMSQPDSWEMDYLVNNAEQDGIYVMPILKHDDQKNFDPGDQLYIRYAVSRWGYSPAIMAWDTFKEGAGTPATVSAYLQYLTSHDPYRHPTTASEYNHYAVSNAATFNTVQAMPTLSIAQNHDYSNECNVPYEEDTGLYAVNLMMQYNLRRFNKPSFFGETGVHLCAADGVSDIFSTKSSYYNTDPNGMMLEGAIWGELLSTAGAFSPWNYQIGPTNQLSAFKPLAAFVKALPGPIPDSATLFETLNNNSQATVSDPKLTVMGRKDADFGILRVSNSTGTWHAVLLDHTTPALVSNATTTLLNMSSGKSFTVEWFNTQTGALISTAHVNANGTNLTLSIPTVANDVAAFVTDGQATPPPSSGPTASLSASSASVTPGGSSTLTWSSTNATSCTASGSWSGSKALSGSASTGALTASATYVLTCAGTGASASATATVTVGTASATAFSHIFTIVMENKAGSSIAGNSQAPYLGSLIKKYGYGANYFAVGRPSLPNYLGMTGGSTFGHTSDCLAAQCPVNAANIADELEGAGLTWKAYMESMPSACSTTDTTLYRQKHNPFVYYNDIRTNASRCQSHDVPYTQFAADLSGNTPNYSFITPNMQNDMHDGTVAQGDAWLASNVPAILNSAAWKNNGLLVIVWDEQDGSNNGVTAPSPAIMISPQSKSGFTSNTKESHYSLLRTVEDNWKLTPLAGTANASAMTEYFSSSTPPPNAAPVVSLSASPVSVTSGSPSTLTWSSTNATSCTASGSWSGGKALSGSSSTGGLASSAMYSLTCSGAGGTASTSASVTVGNTPPPPPGSHSVTLDKTSHASSNGNLVPDLSWSHTTAGQANSVLVVSVAMGEPLSLQYTVGSVTYNGKSLKKLASEASPAGGCYCNLELWYTTAPSAGTHPVVVRVHGGNHAIVTSATSYYNVGQSTPFGTLVVRKGYTTNTNPAVSTTVASTPNQAVLNVWTTNTHQSFAPEGGQTGLWNDSATSGTRSGFSSTVAGGVSGGKSSTPTWKITSGNPQPFSYADIAVALLNAD